MRRDNVPPAGAEIHSQQLSRPVHSVLQSNRLLNRNIPQHVFIRLNIKILKTRVFNFFKVFGQKTLKWLKVHSKYKLHFIYTFNYAIQAL